MKLIWYPGGANEGILNFPGTASDGITAIGAPLIDYSGFSGNAVSHQIVRSPGQHGATWLDSLYDPRKLSFSAWITATTLQGLLDTQREIVAAFDVGKGRGALVWEQEDGKQYLINCIADGSCPVSNPGISDRGIYSQRLTFPLIAHDPFWYSGSPHPATFKFVGKSFFPFNFPFNFQSSQSPSQSIINAGSHNAPVHLKFVGPMTNPVLTNTLTGKSLGLTLAILAGESVEINTDENDLYAIYNATAGSGLAFQYLDATTVLREFFLIPGSNPCQLSSSSYGSGAELQLQWSDKHAGL